MANNLPKGKKVDWDKVKQAAENIRNEKNNLQETIEEILGNYDWESGKLTTDKATEAILQAVRDYCKCDCDDKN